MAEKPCKWSFNKIYVCFTEVRGFKSHLGLGFFSESSFLHTFNIIVDVVVSLTYSLKRLVGCI